MKNLIFGEIQPKPSDFLSFHASFLIYNFCYNFCQYRANGITFNDITFNGIAFNSIIFNGITSNGYNMQKM